jgi:DNA-binding MarR family transcriptional regulator
MATEERTAATAWALVWQIFHADKTRRWGILADLGLTPVQGMALGALDADDPPTMSELGTRMICDRSTLTGVVDRLEALGIVERRPAPRDRRARCVALTEAGVELQRRLRAAMSPPPPQLEHLTAEEAGQLHDLLAAAVQRHAAAQEG